MATPEGWLPIESIRVGDGVVTFDDGIQAVAGVSRRLHGVRPAEKRGPRPLLSVPAGLIGNRRPLVVDQGQGVMVESDLAQTILRDQFALVEAAALSRLPPIRKVLPEAPTVMVTLGFEEPQMIFAEGRALMLCPADDLLNPMTLEAAMRAGLNARYQLLPRATAEMIVASIGMKQHLSHWRSNLKPDPSYA